jgi:hypothetical protein
MPSASTIRLQIETVLAQKIPSALTPAPKMIRPLEATGIEAVDAVLHGGLPIGAISELVGPEGSGRTSLAVSFLAQMTQAGKVCAWIDVSNAFDPLSAAAAGVDLSRLLWVRCGIMPASKEVPTPIFALPSKYLVPVNTTKGLHGGGCGRHPRSETKGLSQAVGDLLRPEANAPRYAEPQRTVRSRQDVFEPNYRQTTTHRPFLPRASKPWSRMEQAMRTTDLLLQAGGFGAIVLDMASLAPEAVNRVPLATWFRYRAAAERTQSSILLLTQHPCAKSSAELLLRLAPGETACEESTVFGGLKQCARVERHRFTQLSSNVISMKKPTQSDHTARWHSLAVSGGWR